MVSTKTVKGTLTIDTVRGVYIQKDARGTREFAYRSERTAMQVAQYMKWRGYQIKFIFETKKKGERKTMNAEQKEKRLARMLQKAARGGATSISWYHRKALMEGGYLLAQNRITDEGRALMAKHPAEEPGATRKMKKRMESTANALRMVEADGLDGVSPARERSLRNAGYLDTHGLTEKAYALMEEYPSTLTNHSEEAELSEVNASQNGNGRVVSSAPVRQTPSEPVLTQDDKARLVLRSVRGRLLRIVRESLPEGMRGLVDEVAQINEILDD